MTTECITQYTMDSLKDITDCNLEDQLHAATLKINLHDSTCEGGFMQVVFHIWLPVIFLEPRGSPQQVGHQGIVQTLSTSLH